MQYIAAIHFLESGHNVTNGIVSHMSHMQFAGWIREHFQTVVLLLGVIFNCFEALILFPVFLPFLLNFLKVILLVHFMSNPPLR